jgi:hypothetical protein
MTTDTETIKGWMTGRLPDDLFTGPADIEIDRDEIVVIGPIEAPTLEEGADEATKEAAIQGRVKRFREETRGNRMKVAQDAEAKFGRKVSWGARIGDSRYLFTHLSIPVMTRLRMAERRVLDTLVDAGAATSRSDALAWCVRLVEKNQGEWLTDLRDAFENVERVRSTGPQG